MELKQIPEDFIVRERPGFTKNNGHFSIFLLKKRDYTTEKAIQNICRALHIDRKRVGYAGIKDRHAVTEQYISIDRVKKDKVDSLKLKDIELRFISSSRKPISLGDLKGNYFEIVVRDLKSSAVINPDVKIKNVFDEQRFSKNNVAIGKLIIKKDFKKAVDLILEGDGDYEQEVKSFLNQNKNNFIGALRVIPHKLLMLFIHSYQSHIFNETINQIDSDENIRVPMVGFGTEYNDDKIEKIIVKILEKENVSERDFIVSSIPSLSCEGEMRDLYVQPANLEVGELEKDDLNKGKFKVKIIFSLQKGAYATNVIKQIVQP
ncbi:MAG: tRNA pseudouridine(13) synthase TruD [archaeon]